MFILRQTIRFIFTEMQRFNFTYNQGVWDVQMYICTWSRWEINDQNSIHANYLSAHCTCTCTCININAPYKQNQKYSLSWKDEMRSIYCPFIWQLHIQNWARSQLHIIFSLYNTVTVLLMNCAKHPTSKITFNTSGIVVQNSGTNNAIANIYIALSSPSLHAVLRIISNTWNE